MDAKEAVREAMKVCGWSQETLAKKCGMKRQSNVTGVLNRGSSMRVDILLQMVHAMGFELVLRDGRGKQEFVIDRSEAPAVIDRLDGHAVVDKSEGHAVINKYESPAVIDRPDAQSSADASKHTDKD